MLKTYRQLIDLDQDSSKISTVQFGKDVYDSLESEILFFKNLPRQSQDWIYRTKKVNYTTNGQWYRCKPFDQINWNNSIVIFGCSNVFGLGVDDNDTLAVRLQSLTNCDVINLGVRGSCQLFNLYNMILLKNKNIKPKAIIHVWTDSKRPFTVDVNYNIEHHGNWNDYGATTPTPLNQLFGNYKSHIVSAMFNRMIANTVYNDIPVIHATYFNELWKEQTLRYPNLPIIFFPTKDWGRDLKHPGIESHINAADLLYQELIKTGMSGGT